MNLLVYRYFLLQNSLRMRNKFGTWTSDSYPPYGYLFDMIFSAYSAKLAIRLLLTSHLCIMRRKDDGGLWYRLLASNEGECLEYAQGHYHRYCLTRSRFLRTAGAVLIVPDRFWNSLSIIKTKDNRISQAKLCCRWNILNKMIHVAVTACGFPTLFPSLGMVHTVDWAKKIRSRPEVKYNTVLVFCFRW